MFRWVSRLVPGFFFLLSFFITLLSSLYVIFSVFFSPVGRLLVWPSPLSFLCGLSMFHIQGSLVLPGTGLRSSLLYVLLSFGGLWGWFPLPLLFRMLDCYLFWFFSWFPILCLGWSLPCLWFALFFPLSFCFHILLSLLSCFFVLLSTLAGFLLFSWGCFLWWLFWKAAFFIFLFSLATLISSLFSLGSLSVLIFFFPIVFAIVSRTSLSNSGYSILLSSSLLWFISLLNLSHPSSLARFHFSIYVFFLGRLVVTVVMMVLWSVSFFPLTLNCPSSSTIVTDGFAIPFDVTM